MRLAGDWDWLELDALAAAPQLLGCTLVHGHLAARIVEVEAYRGADDAGSHGHRGMTPRNAVMFGPPGFAYVYFTYGTHWMLNVSCAADGVCGAILIRAAVPLKGQDTMRSRRGNIKHDRELLSGPAKICQAFGIDRRHNGAWLIGDESFRLERGDTPLRIRQTPRIGLAKGKGDELPWRLVDADAGGWLSRPLR